MKYPLPGTLRLFRAWEIKCWLECCLNIDPDAITGPPVAPPSNTGDKQCFQLMKNWLRTCTTTHDCMLASEAWLPTRLIDVGGHAGPRLVHSADIENRGVPYATLSHRWTEHVVRLTTLNIHDFQRELPAGALSRTFLDAFTVTQNLGMRYIWIDSLCILQDSVHDWEVESAQMWHIYENGLCNFAGSAASGGRQYDGLFRDREPLWGVNSQVKLPDQVSGKEFVASVDLRHRWDINVGNHPLNRRGWVFQERFLSPRTIYFGSSEIFWECQTCFESESVPLSDSPQRSRSIQEGNLPDRFKRSRWHAFIHGATFRDLQRLSCAYVTCALTRESDRLVALAGIAKALSGSGEESGGFSTKPSSRSNTAKNKTKKTYLAGLWEEDLPWNLWWSITFADGGFCTKPSEYRGGFMFSS